MSEAVVEELCERLRTHLGVQVQTRSEGSAWVFEIVGECFSGLSRVRRQQLVNAHLAEAISSGQIHAVILHTHTPEEAARRENSG
ncbi:MAG: BolA/IbaG family iron-sulfur metabolism protein [Gammaproteobacteria bacterium AqS3]|nr:BolA/IbaG family iron-sulfur metabolism protein [Gammaproteobacteria bacterium AqS3]